MNYHPLGRTGLDVSAMSLGGAQFGQQYGPLSITQAAEVANAAVDAGVNLIDTSAFYGRGTSESILGEVLAGGLRERVAICTKAGRLDRDVFDFSAAGMRNCFEQSLRRLRTDRVELLLAHDIEYAADFEQVFDETARTLHELKREGKCRFIGMSCLPLGLLKRAVEECELDAVISYCHGTLQDDSLAGDFLPVAQRRGVGVLNASPLSMGLLTVQGPQPWHPAGDDIKKACREAVEFCSARGADISELAMRFSFHLAGVASTITGAATVAQLQTNLKSLDAPPDAELLAAVERILAPVKNATWPSGNWSGK